MKHIAFLSALALVPVMARADYRSPYWASRSHYDVRGVGVYTYTRETDLTGWEGWRRDWSRPSTPPYVSAPNNWYDSFSARTWYRPLLTPRSDYFGAFARYGVYQNVPQTFLDRPQLDRYPSPYTHGPVDPGVHRPRPGFYSGIRRGR
jgi:hypothetical protein